MKTYKQFITEISLKTKADYVKKASARNQETYKKYGAGKPEVYATHDPKVAHAALTRASNSDRIVHKTASHVEDHTPLEHEPTVHNLRHMSHGEVYDHTQTSDKIKDGDVLHVKGGSAIMFKAWPTMVKGKSDALHHFKDGYNHPPRYQPSVAKAKSL